jgi:hypothetical protein
VERKFCSGEADMVTDGAVVLCIVDKVVGSFDTTEVAVADDIVVIAKFFCRGKDTRSNSITVIKK